MLSFCSLSARFLRGTPLLLPPTTSSLVFRASSSRRTLWHHSIILLTTRSIPYAWLSQEVPLSIERISAIHRSPIVLPLQSIRPLRTMTSPTIRCPTLARQMQLVSPPSWSMRNSCLSDQNNTMSGAMCLSAQRRTR